MLYVHAMFVNRDGQRREQQGLNFVDPSQPRPGPTVETLVPVQHVVVHPTLRLLTGSPASGCDAPSKNLMPQGRLIFTPDCRASMHQAAALLFNELSFNAVEEISTSTELCRRAHGKVNR
jgi:hypothetical protein